MSSGAASSMARIMAWLVVILTAGFVIYGLVHDGLSWETQARLWRDVIDRSHGPMTFRFFLQPTMAAIAALHDGTRDARSHRTPYLHTIIHDADNRGARLNEGLISISRIILLGFVMDTIYQWRVLGTFYPGEAVVITLILAVIPYIVLRDIVTRIARWRMTRHPQSHSHG
ncbi:hypothetical protein [Pseudorhodoplanes sp.]|uniref:hypothetical protein n=1 Tax=Pseudorhodoplanes sp. TaxID=1934341 RepID=UPI002C439B32|nr:hypothetical protein [Pseudorhodoplanes sp.]HWV51001.1 hypothetical protein [Pseudorhodoplanes sp.]